MASRALCQSILGSSPTSSIRTASPSPSTSTSKTSTYPYIFRSRRTRGPYPLITNTGFHSLPRTVGPAHACIYFARQMSLIHNTIIRALNASRNHCLNFMAEDSKSPNSIVFIDRDPDLTDVTNFLEYNQLIFKMLDHHHRAEEEFMFQQIEDLLVGIGQPRGSMMGNVAQHKAFEAGLEVFGAYISKTQPAEFQPDTLLHIIESFAPSLIEHLHDEIPTLLALHVLKSKDLMKIWKKAEFEATKEDDLFTSLPFVLGCQDANFELDGEVRPFPPIPRGIKPILTIANKHWFSRRKAGVWRFLPRNTSKDEVRPRNSASSRFHEEL